MPKNQYPSADRCLAMQVASILASTDIEQRAIGPEFSRTGRTGARRNPMTTMALPRPAERHERQEPRTARTSRVPRPAGHGTGRGGRSPPPGPGRHPVLAGSRRPGRRPPADQRAGDQRHPARGGSKGPGRRARHRLFPRPASRRCARHVALPAVGGGGSRRRGDRPRPAPGRDAVRRVGLLPHPGGQGRVLHARIRDRRGRRGRQGQTSPTRLPRQADAARSGFTRGDGGP